MFHFFLEDILQALEITCTHYKLIMYLWTNNLSSLHPIPHHTVTESNSALTGPLGDDAHKTHSVNLNYHFSYRMLLSHLRSMHRYVDVNIIDIISIFAGTYIVTSLLATKSFHLSSLYSVMEPECKNVGAY